MMTKCIGGKFDGEYTTETGQHIVMRKAPKLFKDFHLDMRPDSTTTANTIAQEYTRRSLHCDGEELYFYAPPEQSYLDIMKAIFT